MSIISARSNRILLLYYIVIVFFLFSPILMGFYFSFGEQRFPSFPIDKFSLDWYADAWADSKLLDALQRSALVAALVAPTATILGGLGAYADYRYRYPGRRFALALGLMPPTIPVLILALAFLAYLSELHLTASLYGVFIAHTVICLPFAMALIRLRLSQLDPELESAAWNLGAGEWRAFLHIVLVFCRPMIFVSLMITFIISFDEFTIAWFVSGTEQTLPVKVLNMVERQSSPVINAIGSITSLFTLAAILIALLVIKRLDRTKWHD